MRGIPFNIILSSFQVSYELNGFTWWLLHITASEIAAHSLNWREWRKLHETVKKPNLSWISLLIYYNLGISKWTIINAFYSLRSILHFLIKKVQCLIRLSDELQPLYKCLFMLRWSGSQKRLKYISTIGFTYRRV